MLIAITILLDILKNEGMTNCDWKANSMKASGQTRIGFPVLVTVTLSLDYLLFRYFQYAFHLDVFSIWRKSTALPPTGLVKKSLKPKYFPDFFQLTLKRCIFAVPLNLEKV